MSAQRRKRSDGQRLLEALTGSESDTFIKEIGDRWHASAHRARLAIANTPTPHKREMLLAHLEDFGQWLFTRVRQSLIERVEVGRCERVGKVEELSTWAEKQVERELGVALIPGLAETEELPDGIVQFGDYIAVVRDWLAIASAGWQTNIHQIVGWQAPQWALGDNKQENLTEMLVEGCTSMMMEQVVIARSHARAYCIEMRLSGASTVPAAVMNEIGRKLANKIGDFSRYLDNNVLTELQRECVRLSWEHGLTVPEIAIHLKKHRKTIHEHLARGQVNIERAMKQEKSARRRAALRPDDQR